jgi:hypothetical protein
MSAYRDYLTYVHFCCAAGVVPWTLEQWALMTQQSVDIHWQRWAEYITKVKKLATWADTPDDREGAWARHKRPHKSDDALLADVRAAGLFIGELRPDGSVNIVRHQTAACNGGGHKLLFRVCRAHARGRGQPIGGQRSSRKAFRLLLIRSIISADP